MLHFQLSLYFKLILYVEWLGSLHSGIWLDDVAFTIWSSSGYILQDKNGMLDTGL